MNKNRRDDDHWSVDKKIPLALIVSMFIQTVCVVWWASDINSRVDVLEKQQTSSAGQAEIVIRLDERLNNVQRDVTDIKSLLSRKELKDSGSPHGP